MKKQRVRKIKVRYISSTERNAEREIDTFLQKVNGATFNVLAELRHA